MIKINLLSKKRFLGSSGSGQSAHSSESLLAKLKELNFAALQELGLHKMLVPMVIAFVVYSFLDQYKSHQLSVLGAELAAEQEKATALSKQLEKASVYDALKKELDADESIIRNKLDILKKLIEGRGDSVAMLEILSSKIPQKAWLTEYSVTAGKILVRGEATDYNQISDFMKNLRETGRFPELELKESSELAKQGGKGSEKTAGRDDFELRSGWK